MTRYLTASKASARCPYPCDPSWNELTNRCSYIRLERPCRIGESASLRLDLGVCWGSCQEPAVRAAPQRGVRPLRLHAGGLGACAPYRTEVGRAFPSPGPQRPMPMADNLSGPRYNASKVRLGPFETFVIRGRHSTRLRRCTLRKAQRLLYLRELFCLGAVRKAGEPHGFDQPLALRFIESGLIDKSLDGQIGKPPECVRY
ncbi:hypothetical protein EV132_103150 [Rhizobium sullae]|uniref:Uncharacterized protein n=1 Tax=Rhizobium sullae TaxID=50338 RepID=A0A4R3Q9S4_RHISU|nr:hypothetical protein EV132_103150 [Rhizobium sullae]